MANGWGGRRVGAGRKPKSSNPSTSGALTVFPGGKDSNQALRRPPRGLPPALRATWRRWAPLALERRTLTPETVPAFEKLCELEGLREAVVKGMAGAPVAPAELRVFLQCVKQVEALLARFCLAPFGKPIAPDKPKGQAVNPWGAVGAK